jgi:ubiquinone/menaquinone biosynthesis C-methylase UbiE
MASAFYESCTLFAASDLGLFAALAEQGPSSAQALADTCGLDARAARLLADGCVAIGLLIKDDDLYSNSAEAAAFLVPGSPGDLSRAIRYNRDVYEAWGKLTEFGKTGVPVEKPALHLGDDEKRTRAFVHAMHGRAMGIGRAVVPMLQVPEGARILDIGGGSGAYSMLVCEANPGATSTLLDLPGIVAVSSELIAERGLDDRVTVCPGDYHTATFPSARDVVMILGVLHQESPDDIVDILARSYASLKPGGAIYIMDLMTDATRCAPSFAALFAINMALTKENGWVFSDEDMRAWLAQAGFESIQRRELPPPMPHWMMSGVKPG